MAEDHVHVHLSLENIALIAEIGRQQRVLMIELYPKRMRVDIHPDDWDDLPDLAGATIYGMPVLLTKTIPRGKPRVIALDTY